MGKKVLIVAASFYQDITEELIKGATEELESRDVEYEIVDVPGAFEIPATIGFAKNKYGGFIALGCVIRGETSHYDYVCGESAHGLQELAVNEGLAIGNGILTVENMEQAMERAGVDRKNKGRDAAHAALRMMGLKEKFT